MPAVKILDTAISATGLTQIMDDTILHRNVPLRIEFINGGTDTIVLEGKVSASEAFTTIYTSTTTEQQDFFPAPIWRVRRSAGAGTSRVWLSNCDAYTVLPAA